MTLDTKWQILKRLEKGEKPSLLMQQDDKDDDEDITVEPAVPSHSQAFTSLLTSLRWLEAQDSCVLLHYSYHVDYIRTQRASELQN